MNVFDTHAKIVGDYASYIRSFINISDPAIKITVDAALEEGKLWPQPLLQFNPSFEMAGSVADIARTGLLHGATSEIFKGYSLYRHQLEAVKLGIDSARFMELVHDTALARELGVGASSLEGYLMPATYHFYWQSDEGEIVRTLVGQFWKSVDEALREEIATTGWSLHEVVTLASIVELETARAEERPRIAAVFLNRLSKGMLLQTDPSVIYALKKAGRWDGNIRREDLQLDSPYNTYQRAGLPPGPIGCPGRDAILAVIDPAPTRDLYFVSRNDGTHAFSRTLDEHNSAVAHFQHPPGRNHSGVHTR